MNVIKDEFKIEPFYLLFPTGCLLGFLGLVFWFFFQLGWIHFYPRFLHGNLMFFGFLWSFIAGFLMTAVPKMMMSSPARVSEVSIAISLVFVQIILNIRNLSEASVIIFLVQNIALAFFILRRFLVHRKIPFFGFVFLPIAFIQLFSGILLYFLGYDRSHMLLLAGEAFVLNLILGLGSRLIPVISRLPNSLLPNELSNSKIFFWPLLCLFFINIGYGIDFLDFKDIGLVLRIIGLSIASVKILKLFVIPATWSYVGIGLKISILMMIIGHFLSFSFLNNFLAGQHFTYIGGFSGITLMVATRVILAHGKQNLIYEISSLRIAFIIGFILLSSVLRYTVGRDVSSFILSLSALFFLIAIGLWFNRFYRIFKFS